MRSIRELLRLSRSVLFSVGIMIFCSFFCANALADKITTVHGHSIEGKIIEETDNYIRIRSVDGAVVQLPRSIIKDVAVVKLSALESEAELALIDGDMYKALELLNEAMKKGDASEGINQKISSLREQIERQESEQYRNQFSEGLALTKRGEFVEGQKVLKNLADRAPKEGAYWHKARRALALNYWQQSYDYMDRVAYRKALEAMQNATETDEQFVMAHFDLARLLLSYTNERQEAVDHLDTGLRLFEQAHLSSKTQSASQEFGQEYYDEIMPQEAKVSLKRYYLESYKRAEIEYKVFDKLNAAQRFLDLLQAPELADNLKEQAIDYIVEAYTDPAIAGQMDPEQMHAKLDKALELNPMASNALVLKSNIYLKNGNMKDAVQMLTRSLQINEFQPEIYEKRAHVYLDMGQNANARSDLLKANDLEETYSRTMQLGNLLLEGVDFEEAVTHFNRAAEMDNNAIDPVMGRIKANLQMAILSGTEDKTKDLLLSKAEKDINWVLTKDRTMRDAKLQLARIKRLRDKDAEAREILTDIINELQLIWDTEPKELTEKDADILSQAYTERGFISSKNNNLITAESDFQKALNFNDKYAESYRGIAEIATKRDNLEKAISNLETAITLQPEKPDYNLNMALLYHQYKKNYEKAIAEYKAYERKGGFDPRLDSWIQECRIALQTNIVVIKPVLTTTETLATSPTVAANTTVTLPNVSTNILDAD